MTDEELLAALNRQQETQDQNILASLHGVDPNKSQFSKGLAAGVDSLQGLGYGALGFVGDVVGSNTIRNIGARGMQRNQFEASLNAPRVRDAGEIESAGDLGSYIAYNTGQLLPSVAESLGAAALGGVTGGPVGAGLGFVGKQIVKKTLQDKLTDQIKEKALKAAGATALNAYGTGVGDIYQETSQGGTVDPNAGIAAAAAAPYAALEYLADINLARMVGIGKTMDTAAAPILADLTKTSAVKHIAKKGLQQAGIETATEMGQEALLTGSAELQDPSTMTLDGAIDRIIETGFATFAGTLIPGLAGGAINRAQQRTVQPNEKEPAPAPKPVERPATEPVGVPGMTQVETRPEAVAAAAAATAAAQEQADFAKWNNAPAPWRQASAPVAEGPLQQVETGPYVNYEQVPIPDHEALELTPSGAVPLPALEYEAPAAVTAENPPQQGVLQFASAAPEPATAPVPGSMAAQLQELQKQQEIEAAYAQAAQNNAPPVQAAPSEAEQRKAYYSSLAGYVKAAAEAGGIAVPKSFIAKLREITSSGTQAEHAEQLLAYADHTRSPDIAALASDVASKLTPVRVEETQDAVQERSTAPIPVQPEAQVGEGVGGQVRNTEELAQETGNVEAQQEVVAPPPLAPSTMRGTVPMADLATQIIEAEKPVPTKSEQVKAERAQKQVEAKAATKQEKIKAAAPKRTPTTKKVEVVGAETKETVEAERDVKAMAKMSERELIHMANDVENTDTEFSQRTQATNPTTREGIAKALEGWFLKAQDFAKSVQVVETISEISPQVIASVKKNRPDVDLNTVQAFVHGGKAYMIADRIQFGEERGVFTHELGAHLGLSMEDVTRLAADIKTWANSPEGSRDRRVYDAAMARMKSAGETSDRELVAYAVEEAIKDGVEPSAVLRGRKYEERGGKGAWELVKFWAQSFMEEARRVLGLPVRKIKAEELIDFVYGALGTVADGKTQPGTFASTVSKFQDQAMSRADKLLSTKITAKAAGSKAVLGFQTFNHIVETWKKDLPALGDLKNAVDQRTADIAKVARIAGDLDRKYTNWAKEVGDHKVTIDGEQQTQIYNLGALMGETTLESILPSDDMTIESQKDYATKKDDKGWVDAYNRIEQRWSKLNDQAKAVYTEAYQLHEELFDQIVEANALNILLTMTDPAYQANLRQQIAKTGRPPRAEIFRDLSAQYEVRTDGKKVMKAGGEAKAGRAAREQFEALMEAKNRQASPYFHVGRFGDYFVRVMQHPQDGYTVYEIKDGKPVLVKKFDATLAQFIEAKALVDKMEADGKDVDSNLKMATEHFERFETPGEMAVHKQRLETMFPKAEGYEVIGGTIDSGEALAGTVTASFLKEMMQRIDGYVGVSDEDKSAFKGMIRKMYVQTLPETSSRRVFQHRQGIKGWRPDEMWRSQARRFEIASRQLGYALHDVAVQEAMEGLRKGIGEAQFDDAGKAVYLQQVVGELAQREREIRSSPDTPIIDLMSRMSFTMFLAASPAYTAINLLQPTVVTLPVLGGRFGFVKSVKALVKATGIAIKMVRELMSEDLFRPEIILDNATKPNGEFVHFPFLKGKDREVMQELVSRGKIDLTQAHEIGHVARDRNSVHGSLDNARHILGMFMHYSELINRAAAGLAAFELASNNPAVQKLDPTSYAANIIDQTQYSYELANRPRQLGKHGVIGKSTPLVGQFQMYNVQTIELLLREFWKAIGKSTTDSEEIKAARKTLAGVFGTTSVIAGTLGAPAATAIAAFVNMLASEDDEPYDAVQAYRRWLSDMLGPEMAEMVAHGVFRPTLDIDMSRAGMQNLVPFSRTMADRREWKEAKESLALDLMGPSAGWLSNMFEGYDRVMDGDVVAGSAMMLPRFASDILKGVKVASDGWMYDAYGNKIPLDPTAADVAKIALGFRPADLAEQREAVYAENTRKMLIGKRKTVLKKELYKAMDSGDQKGIMEGWRAVDEYNASNPNDMLTRQAVFKGFRQREKEYKGGQQVVVPSTGKEARKIGDRYSHLNL